MQHSLPPLHPGRAQHHHSHHSQTRNPSISIPTPKKPYLHRLCCLIHSLLIGIISVFMVVAVSILLLYICLEPKFPEFAVIDATISEFRITTTPPIPSTPQLIGERPIAAPPDATDARHTDPSNADSIIAPSTNAKVANPFLSGEDSINTTPNTQTYEPAVANSPIQEDSRLPYSRNSYSQTVQQKLSRNRHDLISSEAADSRNGRSQTFQEEEENSRHGHSTTPETDSRNSNFMMPLGIESSEHHTAAPSPAESRTPSAAPFFSVGNPGKIYLNTDVKITVAAENPNKKIGILYDGTEVELLYGGESIGEGRIPPFYQGHQNTTILDLQMRGRSVELSSAMAAAASGLQWSSSLVLSARAIARVRVKVGSWKSGTWLIQLLCHCQITKPSSKLSGGDHGYGVRLLSQKCSFDVK